MARTAADSTLLASAFNINIASVNTVPTIGQTETNGHGITINTPGGQIGGNASAHRNLGDDGYYGSANVGNGTWSLTNVGKIYSTYDQGRDDDIADPSDDEFDMKWTYTATIVLKSGDTVNFIVNPEYNHITSSTQGDAQGISYLSAQITPSSLGPPTVTASGSTGQTFTVGSTAVPVDSGLTVSSSDTDITGASLAITNKQTGDTLNFTSQNGITGSYNSSTGTLSLSGSATPAQYQTALQSVTFSTTSLNTATRTIDVVADDSTSSPTTSNTAVDNVKVAIAAPVVTASGSTGQTFTVGSAAVAVDPGVTVSSYDTDLTGATETVSNYQSGDTLSFTSQNGITGSYNSTSGVLTLAGSATPAQYQTALQSVTFSTASLVKGTRTINVVALDSGDTGNLPSNTAIDSAVVAIAAPVVTTSDFQTMLSFNGTDGSLESANDLILVGSTLYGMTDFGGMVGSGFLNRGYGTIFSIPVTGGAPTTLAMFNGTDGDEPRGDLTLSADGSTFYGATQYGGVYGDGDIFSIPVTGGTPTILTSLNGTFTGALTLIGSTLYGTNGVIFSLPVTGGTPTTLATFNGADGNEPNETLTLIGSTFYGTTETGGASNDGTVFSVPVTGGTPTTLASFNGTNGADPVAGLTLSANRSTFYGVTDSGGANGDGSVFSIPVTGGTPTTLLSFNGTNGNEPYASGVTLIGSNLYGMTYLGGANNKGVIYSVPVTGGTSTTLLSFNGTDGNFPEGSLTPDGSTLYGMTPYGGANGKGTVFSINTAGQTYAVGSAAVAVDSGVTVTFLRHGYHRGHRDDRQLPVGRFAPLHQPEWHHRQLLERHRHLDLGRQCHAGPIPDGLAVGHLLHHKPQHRHPAD